MRLKLKIFLKLFLGGKRREVGGGCRLKSVKKCVCLDVKNRIVTCEKFMF